MKTLFTISLQDKSSGYRGSIKYDKISIQVFYWSFYTV